MRRRLIGAQAVGLGGRTKATANVHSLVTRRRTRTTVVTGNYGFFRSEPKSMFARKLRAPETLANPALGLNVRFIWAGVDRHIELVVGYIFPGHTTGPLPGFWELLVS